MHYSASTRVAAVVAPMHPMNFEYDSNETFTPEKFVVEVFAELEEHTIATHAHAVNVILRLSMLAGLQMQLEATLNMLCDLASEVVSFDRGMVYFWDETQDLMHLRVTRNMPDPDAETYSRGNILNFWSAKHGRPLLVTSGADVQADSLLAALGAATALVVPLFVNNKVAGSMQFYSQRNGDFTREHAQLLWILALVAENLLTREYGNEGLLRFAFTDFLTGLKTRGYFEQQLDLEIKRAERKRTPIALLMIDIDFFKSLNDTYGHHVGDQVLRDVASILVKDMREIDTVARYGGEEFVIILPDTSTAGANLVAQRLRRSVEQAKFFAGSPRAIEHISISIGVAVYDSDAQFKRDLIEFADAALYDAKNRGRNRVVLYSEMRRREVS
jgi:diguanylate cyclase (GGDEF)-like protein